LNVPDLGAAIRQYHSGVAIAVPVSTNFHSPGAKTTSSAASKSNAQAPGVLYSRIFHELFWI
jgi:hypothetical protein